jgi:PKD repeat protein
MSSQTATANAALCGVQRLASYIVLLFLVTLRVYAGDINLAWDASPSSGVSGYKIYCSQTSGSYSATACGQTFSATQTSYKVSGLQEGATYYFVATAYNAATESARSNEVSAKVSSSAPVASFSASAVSGVAPLTDTFNCTSTGTITERTWDLGNGTTATGGTVATSYATPGTYTVALTVTGPGGSSTASRTITVTSPSTPPTANFTATVTTGIAPLAVSFSDASSGGTVSGWSWNFGDGGTSTERNPSHIYAAAGTYTVAMTATGPGGSNTTTKAGFITVTAASGGNDDEDDPSATTGLVAAFGFEELSGAKVVDASGSGNHGTLTEATRITSGRYGKAMKFDGVNDWITVNDSASLDLTTAMTLEAWVYPTVANATADTILVKEDGSNSAYYLYGAEDTPQPVAGARIGGYQSPRGPSTLAANQWTHLAGTFDGQSIKLFVNGAQVAEQSVTGTIPASSGVLRIGGNAIWGEFFKGYIDEVRIYNRALSATEIVADSQKAISSTNPPEAKLGDDQVESVSDSNPQGMAEAFRTTAAKAATLTQIQVYVDAGSTATKLVAGLYSDASNHPKSRLATGSLTTLKAGAWNTVPISTIDIAAGKSYWLAILAPSGQLKFRVQGGNSGLMETSQSSTLTSLPATWATGTVYGDGPMSMFGGGY